MNEKIKNKIENKIRRRFFEHSRPNVRTKNIFKDIIPIKWKKNNNKEIIVHSKSENIITK